MNDITQPSESRGRAPKAWIEELEASRRDVEAGNVVDCDEVPAELRALIDQMAAAGIVDETDPDAPA